MPATPADEWARRRCRPCRKGEPALERSEILSRLRDLDGWTLSADGRCLRADYLLEDFAEAVRFVGEIARVAESEDHHPDLHLTRYRRLSVELTTHAARGLTDNDFILAAKIRKLSETMRLRTGTDA